MQSTRVQSVFGSSPRCCGLFSRSAVTFLNSYSVISLLRRFRSALLNTRWHLGLIHVHLVPPKQPYFTASIPLQRPAIPQNQYLPWYGQQITAGLSRIAFSPSFSVALHLHQNALLTHGVNSQEYHQSPDALRERFWEIGRTSGGCWEPTWWSCHWVG